MIGVMHPGAMGVAIATALAASGNEVAWASQGRSCASAERAELAGLRDLGTVAAIALRCEYVVSICPPSVAVETAQQLAGFTGTYVDANAISPRTADRIAELIASLGGTYVDGGIIGLPPTGVDVTRLYLSGAGADPVQALFTGGLFDTVVLRDGGPYAASALKMTFAAWTKGSTALLLAVANAARSLGIAPALAREWDLSGSGLNEQLHVAELRAQEKGWRWVAEMREIAATFALVGQPSGFGEAAADVFTSYHRPEQPEQPGASA